MRQSFSMRIDPDVLNAARGKARNENRSLTNYIETLVRLDLKLGAGDATLDVIAPADIRNSVAIPVQGESEEELKRRGEVFFAVLDAAGY